MNEARIRQRWYGDGPIHWWHKLGTWVFARLVALRGWLYRVGLKRTHKVNVPVLVVGNITAGGGGKTPMVIWLAQHLQSLGYKPGIVSRGYGGKRKVEPMFVTANANPAASGDEPLLMAKKTQLPVMVGKDRVKACRMLIKNYSVNVIVADDGLQHLALGRDAEIVMLDARWRTGNHQMIPAGPLREPLERLNSVDLVVFKGHMEDQHHYEIGLAGIHQLNHPSVTQDVAEFRNKKVVAMAGIANPDSFFSLLAAAGMAIVKQPLPDHHEISEADFAPYEDTAVLITEKDAVKCENMNLPHVWVVKMELHMPAATRQAMDDLIQRVMS